MCLGIPGKILEIKGDKAIAAVAGTLKEINLKLMEGVQRDDYVIIHAGFAIEKVDPEKALETLKLIEEVSGR